MLNSSDVREVVMFMVAIIVFVTMLLLAGCSSTNISNKYYQTNYGEECLYSPHTDSYKNLLFCQQQSLVAEHSQNKLANKD